MINILLEGYGIGEPWLFEELKKYIKPDMSVAVVPFAFREGRVNSLESFNALYGKDKGYFYRGIVGGLSEYGIPEEKVEFVNYFTDTHESAAQKVKNADIVYFPGGLPDKMMERIEEFCLFEALKKHDGIVMGYSAGALIQLSEYHLSPDHDYPEFKYYKGLPYISDFYLEVHYDGNASQIAAIKRVLAERKKTVFATSLMSGAIIVNGKNIKLLGKVEQYN